MTSITPMPVAPPAALAQSLLGVEPIVWLLPLVAIYAGWRAVVYAKRKRWVLVIPIVCVVMIALTEFAVRLIGSGPAGGSGSGPTPSPGGGTSITTDTVDVSGAPSDIGIAAPPPPPPVPAPAPEGDASTADDGRGRDTP